MQYSTTSPKKTFRLTPDLRSLEPLMGTWDFTGTNRNEPNVKVEGRETYRAIDDGKAIRLEGETWTIRPEGKELYSCTFILTADPKSGRIIGKRLEDPDRPDSRFEFTLKRSAVTIESENFRFTGKLDPSGDRIVGKWDFKTGVGGRYWYDKELTLRPNQKKS